jgi:CubicO group peptidase (beta-lactamase class C family)
MNESCGSFSLRAETSAAVDHAVRCAQRAWRSPGVSVGIVRDGALVHSVHVGSARLDPTVPADDDTHFLMGSVTKTFTGLVVMMLRDEGRLELDDPIDRHLPGIAHGRLTIRGLLAHLSGLQREPVGNIWDSVQGLDVDELMAGLPAAETVLEQGELFHYSNLAYILLAQVVERITGQSWEQAVTERVCRPLGMSRTGLTPRSDRMLGYAVHPFAGTAAEEPLFDLGAAAPLGGLWSTIADLARYSTVLTDPDQSLIRPETLDQMCRPLVMIDHRAWTVGYGLSWGMVRRGERIYVGHAGAMPGYLTGLRASRADRLAVVAVANTTAGAAPIVLAADLLDLVLGAEPTPPAVWVPEGSGQIVPQIAEVLGLWWSEGQALVFQVRDGQLWCTVPGEPAFAETRFALDGPDGFRAVHGRECGERLELHRDESGRVTRMSFATYAVTREPASFGDLIGS